MYIQSPQWYLKKECPCCNQNSLLELFTCDKCDKVIAICDEFLTVYLNPLNIALDNIANNGNAKDCPHCKQINTLRASKDFELIALGLTPKEYE